MKSNSFGSVSFLMILLFISNISHSNAGENNLKTKLRKNKSDYLDISKKNNIDKSIDTTNLETNELKNYNDYKKNIYIILLSTTIVSGIIFLAMLFIFAVKYYQLEIHNPDCDNKDFKEENDDEKCKLGLHQENNDKLDQSVPSDKTTNVIKIKNDFKLKFLKLYKERKSKEKLSRSFDENNLLKISLENEYVFNNLSFNKMLNMSSIEESNDENNSSLLFH